jgi:hypothetical protein
MVEDLSEVRDPPRTRTTSYYFVLCLLVAPVWGFIPASWAFFIWSLYNGDVWTCDLHWRIAFIVASVEVSTFTNL